MRSFSWLASRSKSLRMKAALGRRRATKRFVPNVGGLEERALLSTLVVTNRNDTGPGSLRNAIDTAASGDTITFAPSAYGTINVSSTNGPLTINDIDLTIQGPGAGLETISGGGTAGIFYVFGPFDGSSPNSVSMSGLTLADGNATNNFDGAGGAILDFGTTLSVSNCVFTGNQAPQGFGGAIEVATSNTLNLANDVFRGNTSGSPDNPNFSGGGAIFCSGPTTVSASVFDNNQAIGFFSLGGAIHAGFNSTLSVTRSTFTNNLAQGSSSAIGGAIMGDPGAAISLSSSQFLNNEATAPALNAASEGGAVCAIAGTDFFGNPIATTITNCNFNGNRAIQTASPSFTSGVQGGAIAVQGGVFTMSGTSVTNNEAICESSAGQGGAAVGGAMFTVGTQLIFSSDAFVNNFAQGGSGEQGVWFAAGGAIDALFGFFGPTGPQTSTITNSTFVGNAVVGADGDQSFAFVTGGAISNNSDPLVITGTSFVANQAVGGNGVNGSIGCRALGGAIYNYGESLTIQGGSIIGNSAKGGNGGNNSSGAGGAGGDAYGGGISNQSATATITGTLIAGNSARGGAGGIGSTTNGAGGNAFGGGIAIDIDGSLAVFGALITGNSADGGAGGPGASDGQGFGGGIAIVSGTATITKSKVIGNHASTAGDNIYGPATIT